MRYQLSSNDIHTLCRVVEILTQLGDIEYSASKTNIIYLSMFIPTVEKKKKHEALKIMIA